MCSKFSTLLGLEGRSEGCIDMESQSSKCVCRRQNNAQFVQQIGVVQGDGGLRIEERCLLQRDRYPGGISPDSPEGEFCATDRTC